LREGIQDAEKIRLLRTEFEKADSPEAKEKLQRLNNTVAKFNFTKDPGNLEEINGEWETCFGGIIEIEKKKYENNIFNHFDPFFHFWKCKFTKTHAYR
jgi:hypothetical protein